MKAKEIYETYANLNSVKGKKIPVKTAFIVSRNMKKMQGIVEDLDAGRQELLEKYGERNESGALNYKENGSLKITDPDKYIEELTSIMSADLDFTFDYLSQEDIEKCDEDGYDKLTVEEIGALMSLVGDQA